MRSDMVKKLAAAGVLGAAILMLTALVSVPLPGGHGYINLGDAGVLVAAYVLGGGWGFLCAGAASALADLLLGWGVYAPATFVIKGACAFLAALSLKRLGIRRGGLLLYPVALLVPLGYFLYETVLYGAAAAALNVPLNLVQCLAGAGLAHGLIAVLNRHAQGYISALQADGEHARKIRSPKGGANVTLIARAPDEQAALRTADILSVQGYTACVLLIDPASKEKLSDLVPGSVPKLRYDGAMGAEEFAKLALREIRYDL